MTMMMLMTVTMQMVLGTVNVYCVHQNALYNFTRALYNDISRASYNFFLFLLALINLAISSHLQHLLTYISILFAVAGLCVPLTSAIEHLNFNRYLPHLVGETFV